MSMVPRSKTAFKSVQTRVFASTNQIVKRVEEAVGIEEVRKAQEDVLKSETLFVKAQSNRRNKQQELTNLQNELKGIQNKLSKMSRSDDRYLDLVTDEHGLLRQEENIQKDVELLEQAERNAFTSLSSVLRYSHERERAYGERTKYFSLVGSVTGALVGAIATGLSGYLRVRELHAAVDASADQCGQLHGMVERLEEEVKTSSDKNTKFLEEFRHLVGINSAAVLLAGVGDDDPKQAKNVTNNSKDVDKQLTAPELLQFMFHATEKLASIESVVQRLTPVEAEGDGSLVIRCDHSHSEIADVDQINKMMTPSNYTTDDFDDRLKATMRNYTLAIGSLAIASGVAITLSIILSFR